MVATDKTRAQILTATLSRYLHDTLKALAAHQRALANLLSVVGHSPQGPKVAAHPPRGLRLVELGDTVPVSYMDSLT